MPEPSAGCLPSRPPDRPIGQLPVPSRKPPPADRKVAITVATRGRPDGCRQLVESLLQQEIPLEWESCVFVVENGVEGSLTDLSGHSSVAVFVEPQVGIPFARNRGLEEALAWADVIVFIDDDEVPMRADWLRVLVGHLDLLHVDVVSGPVIPRFGPDTPLWISEQPIFRTPRRDTGQRLDTTATSNTACRAEVFGDGLRFRSRFTRTGGSDTDLFHRARAAGAAISWASSAAVIEEVPPNRASVRWILRRSFRIGGNRLQVLGVMPRPGLKAVHFSLGSLVEVVAIPVSLLLWAVSRKRALWLMGRGFRGLGFFASAVRVRLRAYA